MNLCFLSFCLREILWISSCSSNNLLHYSFPECNNNIAEKKIVIVGSGPAGLYCGLMLAKAGLKPLIIERGSDVDTRSGKVEAFWNGGELDSEPEHFLTASLILRLRTRQAELRKF